MLKTIIIRLTSLLQLQEIFWNWNAEDVDSGNTVLNLPPIK
jgi:hypothetical protein